VGADPCSIQVAARLYLRYFSGMVCKEHRSIQNGTAQNTKPTRVSKAKKNFLKKRGGGWAIFIDLGALNPVKKIRRVCYAYFYFCKLNRIWVFRDPPSLIFLLDKGWPL
jgi:hypothetical protein